MNEAYADRLQDIYEQLIQKQMETDEIINELRYLLNCSYAEIDN